MPRLTEEEAISIRQQKEELLDSLHAGERHLFARNYTSRPDYFFEVRDDDWWQQYRKEALFHSLAQLEREVELTKKEYAELHNPQPVERKDCPDCGAKGKEASHILQGCG